MKNETHEYENTKIEIYKKYLYELDKLSLDEKEQHKRVFERNLKYIYDMKILNSMNCIHDT